mmetsp:Transcript_6423/g.12463  ORF Transcript_6423/g.12463 Transcript_6423/m.12463 type:complete len:1013 (-) Transcript_6423:147-3185(-)
MLLCSSLLGSLVSLCRLLLQRDLVAQAEGNALRLAADAKVAPEGTVALLLDADVDQRVLPEDALGVEVGGKEAAVAVLVVDVGQTLHVGARDNVPEVGDGVRHRRVDRHLVLPLELGPHAAELQERAEGRRDVVHDVDVDVVEDDHVGPLGRGGALRGALRVVVHDVAVDDARLGRGHLDVGPDGDAGVRRHRVVLGALAQLEVAHRRELEAHVGERLVGLVDEEHVKHNVVVVHGHHRLGVDRVRQPSQLHHALEARPKVLLLGGARRPAHIQRVLILDLRHHHALTPELPKRQQVVGVRLDLGLALVLLLGLRRQRLLLLHQQRTVALPALLRPDLAHAGIVRVLQHHQAQPQALLAVVVHPARGHPRHAQPHNPAEDLHALPNVPVDGLLRHLLRGRQPQQQLRQRRRRHARKKEVPPQQQRPQARRLVLVDRQGVALPRAALRRVRAVGEHRGGLPRMVHRCVLRTLQRLLIHEGQAAQRGLDGRDGALDLGLGEAVLGEDPHGDPEDLADLDRGEEVGELVDDELPQARVCLDDLAHEEHHLRRAVAVGVIDEVDEHVHHRGGNVGKLDYARVDRLDEHLAVLGRLLHVARLGLDDLLLEHRDDLVDGGGVDELHDEVQHLLLDVDVGRAQAADNVHDQRLEHVRVLLLQVRQLVQHNQLHVVVAVGAEQLAVGLHRSPHRRLGRAERHQCARTLERHRVGRGALQPKHGADVLALLVRVLPANLADELEHVELDDVAHTRNLVNDAELVLHRTLLIAVAQHHKGIALGRHVALAVDKVANDLGSIWHQVLEAPVGVVDAQHRVAPHVRVPVLQVGPQRRHQRLQDVLLTHLRHEAQRGPTHKLVGVVEVVTDHVANENHLRQKVPVGPALLHRLQVKVKQLLERFVIVGNDELNNLHKQRPELLPVEHQDDDLLHRGDLGLRVRRLEARRELGRLAPRHGLIEDEIRALLLHSHLCTRSTPPQGTAPAPLDLLPAQAGRGPSWGCLAACSPALSRRGCFSAPHRPA